MERLKFKACFTLTCNKEQYAQAKAYVEDMRRHPKRVFWEGKEGLSDEALITQQITHRILSGFYHYDAFRAGQQILEMEANALQAP